MLARDGIRLVIARDRERLGAAKHGSERLQRATHYIVLRLLRSQCCSASLNMHPKTARLRCFCAEPVTQKIGPHSTCRTELCYFLEKLILNIEKKGNLVSKVVDI